MSKKKLTLSLKDANDLKLQLRNLAAHQLPGESKFKIYENINLLEPSTKAFTDTRDDLIKEHGKPFRGQIMVRDYIGENGDIKNPAADKFKDELKKLENATMDYDLDLLPMDIFNGDREFAGDLQQVYMYIIERPEVKEEKKPKKN
jgi:hypothetical protein